MEGTHDRNSLSSSYIDGRQVLLFILHKGTVQSLFWPSTSISSNEGVWQLVLCSVSGKQLPSGSTLPSKHSESLEFALIIRGIICHASILLLREEGRGLEIVLTALCFSFETPWLLLCWKDGEGSVPGTDRTGSLETSLVEATPLAGGKKAQTKNHKFKLCDFLNSLPFVKMACHKQSWLFFHQKH